MRTEHRAEPFHLDGRTIRRTSRHTWTKRGFATMNSSPARIARSAPLCRTSRTEGRLQDTASIVSADHGESFEGGDFFHVNPDQTDPRSIFLSSSGPRASRRAGALLRSGPDGARAYHTRSRGSAETGVDARAIAGRLAELMNGDGAGRGTGFHRVPRNRQPFWASAKRNSGVIDGRYQYLLDLCHGKGHPSAAERSADLERRPIRGVSGGGRGTARGDLFALSRICRTDGMSRQYLNLTRGRMAAAAPELASSAEPFVAYGRRWRPVRCFPRWRDCRRPFAREQLAQANYRERHRGSRLLAIRHDAAARDCCASMRATHIRQRMRA